MRQVGLRAPVLLAVKHGRPTGASSFPLTSFLVPRAVSLPALGWSPGLPLGLQCSWGLRSAARQRSSVLPKVCVP